MPTPITILLLVVSLGAALSSGCATKCLYPLQHATTLSVSDLPEKIRNAFQDKFPGGSIVWVGRFGTGADAVYSIQFMQAEKLLAAYVDTFGDIGIAYESVPANPNR